MQSLGFDIINSYSQSAKGNCKLLKLFLYVAVFEIFAEHTILNYICFQGEIFGFCRFSQTRADNPVLYVTAMHGVVVG